MCFAPSIDEHDPVLLFLLTTLKEANFHKFSSYMGASEVTRQTDILTERLTHMTDRLMTYRDTSRQTDITGRQT